MHTHGMSRLTSRAFGSVSVHPLAVKPVPMDYSQLLAEIAEAQAVLAQPVTSGRLEDRIAYRLRLAKLMDAKQAWDQHVSAADPDAAAADAAHAVAETEAA